MKKLYFLLFALLIMGITSCTSESDILEGNWKGNTSRIDDFVYSRSFETNDSRKAYINILSFSKETKNSGTFTSRIAPFMNRDESEAGNPLYIGSEFTGTWEIRDKKLYMNFGSPSNMQLTGSDKLSQREKDFVKSQIFENSWKYIAPAQDGMEFKIEKKDKIYKLKIFFGNQIVEFSKSAK